MDFRQRIIETADQWPIEEARVIRLLKNPRTPHSLIQQFATGVFTGASHFAEAIALMFCQAEHPEAKAFLMENLLEETGVALRDNTFRYRAAQEHTTWARRFCHACQLDNAHLDQALSQAPRWPAQAFALLEQRDWQAAIAYLVVGYERASPRYMKAAYDALLSRGFPKEALAFFHNHIAADEAHGEQGVNILLAIAETPAAQERLLQHVKTGAEDFWHGLNGHNQPVRR